jgi:hypothetical protein
MAKKVLPPTAIMLDGVYYIIEDNRAEFLGNLSEQDKFDLIQLTALGILTLEDMEKRRKQRRLTKIIVKNPRNYYSQTLAALKNGITFLGGNPDTEIAKVKERFESLSWNDMAILVSLFTVKS